MLFVLVTGVLSGNFLQADTASLLRCHPPDFSCPDGPINCECQGLVSLEWTVTSTATGFELSRMNYLDSDAIGIVSSTNGFTAVLCNITLDPPVRGFQFSRLTSKINFILTENVNVQCRDNSIHAFVILSRANSPSEPQNLDSALTSTTNGSVAVRLDWDPPLNDGGVTITNYLIFANISQDVVTANTTITLTLNSTGEYLIEISAVNVCGFTSDKVSWTVNITELHLMTGTMETVYSTGDTAAESTGGNNGKESTSVLSTVAIVGAVIAFLAALAISYLCGLLTGMIVWRRKKHTPSPSGGLLSPTYEQVHPPTQRSINIPLKENEAYGHF